MDLEKIGSLVKDRFDITKVYENYKKCLPGAEEGKVCTRFPPEPSGFLHIGHVKALFLNYHYAKIFKGKMILRFDDTNPAKEKQEYVDNILKDIDTLGVKPDQVTHTSDYFQLIADKCTWMIQNGLAYCDNTDADTMKKERFDAIPSKCRDQSVEVNLKIWEQMQQGDDAVKGYCVRAKMSIDNPNKCMRDPTIYRTKKEIHQRTGDKWKVYPTYDFACPIVDSVEGVTHAMRSNEYTDRIAQFEWFQKKLELPHKTKIREFSRLNFVATVISKRNLTWYVNEGLVDGWDDPRFPTVQGIMRRGLILPTLVEFMLDQGPSKNSNLMEWDKIWAINKNYLENIAGRFTAVGCDKTSRITITNVPASLEVEQVHIHPKIEDLGKRALFKSNKVLVDFDDAENIKEGEKITLMKWGNVLVKSKTAAENGGWNFEAEYLPEDKDWKSTQKITWLAADEQCKVQINEYDHLITKPKIEEDEKLEDFVNHNSKIVSQVYADPAVKELPVGTFLQFERRCFAKIDKKYIDQKDGSLVVELIFIPDGKSKTMSNIKSKVDPSKIAKGGEEKKPEPAKEIDEKAGDAGEEKKPKGEKKVVDEAVKAQKMKEKAEKLAAEKKAKEEAAAAQK